MTLRPILLAVLAALALPAAAQAPVTTVAQLNAAIAAAQPGTTITMADGRWTNAAINFRTMGAVGDSVRLVAQTPGGVVLDGTSSLRIAGDYLVVDGLRFEGGTPTGTHVIQFADGAREAHHSRLTNSTVIDYNTTSPAANTKWISLYGTHNRVDHTYVAGKTNVGTTLVVWLDSPAAGVPTFHRIDHNHFGPRPVLGQNEGETIRIGTSDTSMQDASVTVERNLFDRCDGEAEIVSVKSGNNVIRWNTFFRSRGALTLRHGNGSRVEGNVFLGQRVSGTGGVRVIGEDQTVVGNYFDLLAGTSFESAISIMNGVPNSPLNRYFQVRNATIAHNTVIRATSALLIGAGADAERTLPPENVRFVDNVILTAGNSVVRQDAEPINMTWAGTVYWGGGLGIPEPAGVRRVDPLLAPLGDDPIWRFAAGSPLIDAAVPVPGLALALDIDGQPRDATPDVGADERSTAPGGLRPLTAADVGPAWRMATAGESGPDAAPAGLRLGAPFPSPATGPVSIPLTLAADGDVEVTVMDLLGRRVAVLAAGRRPAGEQTLRWDPAGVAPGVYVVAARSGTEAATARVVVTR